MTVLLHKTDLLYGGAGIVYLGQGTGQIDVRDKLPNYASLTADNFFAIVNKCGGYGQTGTTVYGSIGCRYDAANGIVSFYGGASGGGTSISIYLQAIYYTETPLPTT